jgi:cbb3-type cytochrome oxidase subunit 3
MLHDVVGGAGLAAFAEAALVLFLVVFVVISLRLLAHKRGHYDEVARLPLDDEQEH